MTSRCALYVDAGYLLASAATRVSGSSLRGSVNVDYGSLVNRLVEQAEGLSGLPLLRVNWYDSGGRPGGQADHGQEVLGMLPRVKLRLGRRSPNGEQKGVDVRLGLDLATHGRNHVADVMYLVSGDDDLTEAVEEAQGHGVQVVLLAVPDVEGRAHSVARHLVREADGVELIHPETIDATVHRPVSPPERMQALGGQQPVGPAAAAPDGEVGRRNGATVAPIPPPARPSPAVLAGTRPLDQREPGVRKRVAASVLAYSSTSGQVPTTLSAPEEEAVLELVCRQAYGAWLRTATPAAQAALLAGRPHIPGDIDRALLTDASDRLGIYELDETTRTDLRRTFWQVIEDATLTAGSG